jgi:hypothetical protein
MLIVKINTFPVYPGVAHANPGDIVGWRAVRVNELSLYRVNDSGTFAKSLFSITKPNQQSDFKRGPVGIIGQNKSKNWILEIEEIPEEKNERR